MLHGYYEDEFANDKNGLWRYSEEIKNREAIDRLYEELLSILDEKTFRPEIWEKMLHENDYRRKAALINKLWDAFDTASDDPNIDHKHNRDFLWEKALSSKPNSLPHYEHPDPTNMYDDFNGWDPTGINSPDNYEEMAKNYPLIFGDNNSPDNYEEMAKNYPLIFGDNNSPTGIKNPADYMSKITFEKDTDGDGDIDTKVIKVTDDED